MACTIQFVHFERDENLSLLRLFPLAGGNAVNGAGDVPSLVWSEQDLIDDDSRDGTLYEAEISESVDVGWYLARWYDSDGDLVGYGEVYVAGTDTYLVGGTAPVQAGDKMDLVDEPNSTAVEAIQDGLSTFDPSSDEVDIGAVKGTGVSGVDDFKADVSELATSQDVTDAQEAIQDDIAGLSVNTPGAFPVPLTIKTEGGDLVPGCDVVLTSSNTDINTDRIWAARTDVNGVVVPEPELDAGTYYGWRQKPGYVFTNPFVLTVESDGEYEVT